MTPRAEGRRSFDRSTALKSNAVLSGPIAPFEIWRIIFAHLFDDLDDSRQIALRQARAEGKLITPVLSDLNARFNIFKRLWVSKYWYSIALEVFFEDLQAETAESVKGTSLSGILDTITSHRHLGLAVLRISMSFPRFRETEGGLKKQLPHMIVPGYEDDAEKLQSAQSQCQRIEVERNRYMPSITMQAAHWRRWQTSCASILRLCPSIRTATISFTSSFASAYRNNYRSLFAPPDLRIESILEGLRVSTNLRQLHLEDPSPLEEYGPSLKCWARLKSVFIHLSSRFPQISQLPETAFCPPADLEEFQLHDYSDGVHHWPLKSAITECTDLKVLDLGVAELAHANTAFAIGYLVTEYQSTLTHLTLRRLNNELPRGAVVSFGHIFESSPSRPPRFRRLEFPHLRVLRIDATEDVSFLGSFDAHELAEVKVRQFIWSFPMDAISPEASRIRKEWIKSKLSVPALGRLRSLTVTMERAGVVKEVCEEMGIAFYGGNPIEDIPQAPFDAVDADGIPTW
ncbi:hypothetical protein FRB99_002624 [Tulasnella sp. 403]|nr:hypothetical protein FRB99_002624 [Tulasnella sp. 403]